MLRKWTRPDNYAGASWPDYYSSGFGQSRDSDALERSNFACALKALGGETGTVIVVRESHVGWVEWIAIHESDTKALEIAERLREQYEQYPILNVDHFSEVESEEAQETWANCFSDKDRLQYIRDHRSQFDFTDFADLMGCVRGRYFAGFASGLLT